MGSKDIESMKYEINRYNTFQSDWSHIESIDPSDLAQIGFFNLKNENRVQCAFCRGIVSDWRFGESAIGRHSEEFPDCPFLAGSDVGNVSKSTVKVPSMSLVSKRLESFEKWPVSYWKMAADGLFYENESVQCFRCGGKMTGKDPLKEHDGLYPECKFLHPVEAIIFKEEEVKEEPIQGEETLIQEKRNKCKICMINPSDVVFVPCGHFMSCETCASKITNCAYCRKKIDSSVKVYIC